MADKQTVDGFHPRRPNTRGDNFSNGGGIGFNQPQTLRTRAAAPAPHVLRSSGQSNVAGAQPRDTFRVPGAYGAPQVKNAVAPVQSGQTGLQRPELEESLRQIDQEEQADQPKQSRWRRGRKGGKAPISKRKKIIKRIAIVLLLLALVVGIYYAIRILRASSPVFKGDLFGLVQQVPLQQDENGRTNIVIFGTSEDDEGGDHPGAYLTDSIMLLSVNQQKKDAYMIGIPRDLWVRYGAACFSGMEGKINALYQCYSDDGQNDVAGSKALTEKISEVTGLTTQYYAHVNYGVVREAVNAVGGVDVTIPDYDPSSPGIYDPNFDWKCNYNCKMVNYKDGEQVHMDGEHALAFARARNAEGGYGLPNGNFDREKNQQLVLVALRQKALSAGTLVNLSAVTSLIEAMGNNLRTNFQTNQIRTLMSLGADVKQDAIHSISLNKPGELAVTTGSSTDGQSIVQAVSGVYDYSSIVKYVKKQISAEPFMLENASVVVLNGSGVSGQGKIAADKLVDIGFTVDDVSNAPGGSYESREVYARDDSSYQGTRQKLQSLYGGSIKVGLDGFGVSSDVDFVIIIGRADEAQ